MDDIINVMTADKIMDNMIQNFKKKSMKKSKTNSIDGQSGSEVSSQSVDNGKLANMLFAGMNLRKKRKTERLKVCGMRNQRGFDEFGKYLFLDSYDKMVLEGDIVNIALQKWILRAKNSILNKSKSKIEKQKQRNSFRLLQSLKLRSDSCKEWNKLDNSVE